MRDLRKTNRCPHVTQTNQRRRGVVLFMVVSIVLMMTLLVYGFLVSMRTQNLAAAQAGDQLQARQAAFSAREALCEFLESPFSRRIALDENSPGQSPLEKIVLNFEGEESGELTARGFVLAGQHVFRHAVVNESAKINLQKLLAIDAATPGWGREVLLRLPGMTESIADHLLDWMDEDDQPREFGAESEFYLENFGYRPRNSVPPALLEFTKIPEITQELIYGVNSNHAHQNTPDSENRRTVPTDQATPWSHFLTVRSAERNETFEGNPRIYLNGSDLAKIHAQLTEKTNLETANFVILARQYGIDPLIQNETNNAGHKIMRPGEITVDLTREAQYEIKNALDLIGTVIKLGDPESESSDSESSDSESSDSESSDSESSDSESSEKVTILQSPFSSQNTNIDQVLESFLDGTTVVESNVIQGRINILEAPREVLLSVPGMDEELASQILANRGNRQTPAKTCFWLLSTRLINMEQMKTISPHVTQRGEICQALVVGRSDSYSAPVVFDTLLDATGKTTRQIYSRRIVETHRILDFLDSTDRYQ